MLTYIGFVGFFGIRQSDIYSTERIKVISSGKMTLTQVESALEDEDNNLDKSQKILLSNDQIDIIVKKIEEALVEKKMFTNSKLSLEDLAQEVDIHKNSLSYVINAKLGKNFYLLINEFRIKEAMKLFHDAKLDHISIEGIAQTVGFNSKSVFNPIFKKIVGKTPSEYRKMKNLQSE
jgi:AraC-like DNA-binding protein